MEMDHQMTPAEQFAPLLIRLLEAIVDNPKSVKISSDEREGGVSWGFECEAGDIRKVIGKQGSRLRAIRLIVELAGREAREEWKFFAPKTDDRAGSVGFVQAKVPLKFTPAPDLLLLRALLTSMGIQAMTGVKGDVKAGYFFLIHPETVADQTALLEMHPAIYGDQVETQPINLIGALGPIFRAIAGRQAVKYRLDVV